MGYQRIQRVSEEVKKEIANILRDEIKDPRIGFVSVTKVEVTGDLRYAKVYVSVLGNENNKEQTMLALNKAKGFIRTEIAKRVKLRITPEIIFTYDSSIEYGISMVGLINKVNQEGAKDND